MRFEHSFKDVLLNNYDSLEYENGFLFLEPYQTIVLKLVTKKEYQKAYKIQFAGATNSNLMEIIEMKTRILSLLKEGMRLSFC